MFIRPVLTVSLVIFIFGCGQGTYDSRMDETIQQMNRNAKPAANTDEDKDDTKSKDGDVDAKQDKQDEA